MKSEEIIMLVFVSIITILVPVFMYYSHKEENK